MRFNLKVMSVLALLAPVVACADEFDENVLVPLSGAIGGIALSAFFFLSIAAVIIVAITTRFKINALKHEERMLAIEKGQDLPAEYAKPRDRAMDALRGGLALTFLGIGVAIALGVVAGVEQAVWGGIPFFLGVGLLLYVPLYRKFRKD
jgi:ABC-type phosphate transport system permease subunit